MKKFLSKFFEDDLPKRWIDLIDLIRKNHPDSGGEY
jgi:hypothetical protein